MAVENYQKMIVWQKAMDVTVMVYSLCRKLPNTELYALQNQMKRAAVSIPSNIAEGQSRTSNREFAHYLSMARGSKAELETQLLLCVKLDYLTSTDISKTMKLLEEISKMLAALIKKKLCQLNSKL